MVAFADPDLEPHDIALHGAWPAVASPRPGPTLIERTDEDFISALLEELKAPDAPSRITESRPHSSKLFQPVHRVFNLVLLEAHCETFGEPRLDPRKIDSVGLVVRRVTSGGRYEAWLADKSKVTGWQLLNDEDADPNPERRPSSRLTADASFDLEFRGGPPSVAEAATSLFTAAPEVADATGRTILYGVLPLTSDSRAGEVPRGAEPPRTDWDKHLSLLLRASGERALWPADNDTQRGAKLARRDLADFPIRKEQREAADAASETAIAEMNAVNAGATRFVLLVRQLAQEFSLLRPTDPETIKALTDALQLLSVKLVDGSSRSVGDYLRAAAQFYFEDTALTSNLPRPKTWPAVSEAQAVALADALYALAGKVSASLVPAGRGGRYDDPTSRYAARAFLRVKCPHGCPPKIIWSAYSEHFQIAPWFEQGPVPPVPILLPDIADVLKNARPGVTFSVPRALAKVLNQDPKNFLKGEPGPGTDLGLDWICGFNIPIITICAFVVLNIFLSLLNLVFWWLPFVKICIPFPRKK